MTNLIRRRVLLVAVGAVVMMGCGGGSTGSSPGAAAPPTAGPKTRKTTVHFTMNANTSFGLPATCLGTVATDTLPAKTGETVEWTIEDGPGNSHHDDDCPPSGADRSKISLEFKTAAVNSTTTLTVGTNGKIQGTVSVPMTAAGAYKYRVLYDGKFAGPDPELDINCTSCGPPPEH